MTWRCEGKDSKFTDTIPEKTGFYDLTAFSTSSRTFDIYQLLSSCVLNKPRAMTWTAWAVDCNPWKEEGILLDSRSTSSPFQKPDAVC